MRQVAGEPEQLELKRERERVERRAFASRPQSFDQAEEAGQRLEGAFVPLLFGEEAQHRLGAEQADTEPVLLFAHFMVRANELDAGDGLQLARSLVEHQVDVRERLEARAEPRFRLADPFCHRADSSTLERIEVEDAVGLAQRNERSTTASVLYERPAMTRPV